LHCKKSPRLTPQSKAIEIVYHDFVDLSVAVATPKGLVTPVVRNTETMGFIQIEKEITDLGKKVWVYQSCGISAHSLRVTARCNVGTRRQAYAGRYGRWHIYHVRVCGSGVIVI
jgi:hypothetical protein